MLDILGDGVRVAKAAYADAVCAKEHIRRALEHSAVLEPVSVIERMQYALEHLFDHNICRVAGFDLFIYALQRRIGFMIYLIGPSLELIERAGNSTATSVVWLPKSVIYASFVAGIISVNLSLLGQVPRKVYNIIHGIESDELLLEAQAMAKEFDRELEAEAAKDSDDNADNVGKDGGKKE